MTGSDLLLAIFALLPVAFAGLLVAAYRRGRRAGRGAGWVILGNLLLFATLLSAILAVGEAYYRFVYDTTDGYAIGLVSTRWRDRYYRLNNFQMRDSVDYRAERPTGRPRVTVLGDSYTNGHGVKDVEQRFANRLRKAHPDWEIQVLASDGRDTGAIVDDLERRVRRGYQLDSVLYAYCLNDLSDLLPQVQSASRRLYGTRPGYLVENSYLVNTYYYRLRIPLDPQLKGYFDFVADGYAGDTWRLQQQRLRRLRDFVTAAGGRLSVTTFPFFERMNDPRYREIHRQLDRLWDELDVPHEDLWMLYESQPVSALIVNRYDTHPNAAAHAMAARRIERFLLGSGLPGQPVLSTGDDASAPVLEGWPLAEVVSD